MSGKIIEFTKMHGCGNDYIYIDCFKQEIKNPEELSRNLSRQHFSIGGDGIILICPSDKADAKMRIFNLDGSEGKMCGNGIRCVGKYLYDSGMAKKDTVTVDTLSGIKTLKIYPDEKGKAQLLTVDMGKASYLNKDIPVNLDGETTINRPVDICGKTENITCVSMGNPHCVVFCDDTDIIDIEKEGKRFEKNPIFPEGVNTEFITVEDEKTLRMRVWERGSGETLACGTGACASVAAAVACGYCPKDEDITVKLKGGELKIKYTEDRVYMTGPAVTAFKGEVEVDE